MGSESCTEYMKGGQPQGLLLKPSIFVISEHLLACIVIVNPLYFKLMLCTRPACDANESSLDFTPDFPFNSVLFLIVLKTLVRQSSRLKAYW